MIIRIELRHDGGAIRRTVSAAFGQEGEADLVDALRDSGDAALSLVAEDGGDIAGHIVFSRLQAPARCLALAPFSCLARPITTVASASPPTSPNASRRPTPRPISWPWNSRPARWTKKAERLSTRPRSEPWTVPPFPAPDSQAINRVRVTAAPVNLRLGRLGPHCFDILG